MREEKPHKGIGGVWLGHVLVVDGLQIRSKLLYVLHL